MEDFGAVNWLAVGVGTVAAFMVGWLWYSPLLFGKKWAWHKKLIIGGVYE